MQRGQPGGRGVGDRVCVIERCQARTSSLEEDAVPKAAHTHTHMHMHEHSAQGEDQDHAYTVRWYTGPCGPYLRMASHEIFSCHSRRRLIPRGIDRRRGTRPGRAKPVLRSKGLE